MNEVSLNTILTVGGAVVEFESTDVRFEGREWISLKRMSSNLAALGLTTQPPLFVNCLWSNFIQNQH